MHDIIIVGGGIVGCVSALHLAMNTSLRIAVLESKPHDFTFDEQHYDHRVSAISKTSKKILEKLHVWDAIQSKRISSFTKMHVWDHLEKGSIDFDSGSLFQTATLGYIIEDRVMKSCLLNQFKTFPNIDYLCPVKPVRLQKKLNHLEVILDNQSILSTRLLIGADGADSFVRKEAKMDIKIKEYGHTALVATVETEKPHDETAWQRFMPQGPLAFLPLTHPHLSSIVWSVKHEYAEELLLLSDEQFKIELAKQFNHRLGSIMRVSKRHHFPLYMRHVSHYVLDHIALIGDAAHTLHPLAGQGLNLGIKDAMALSDVIIEAYAKKRNFAQKYILRRYERARKSDVALMLSVVEGLKNLFASENKSITWARTTGLTILNRLPFIKTYLAEYTGGITAISQ